MALCINYTKIRPNYARPSFNLTHQYFHYKNQLQNIFPTVYDMTMCEISPFLAKFGLNYAEIHPNYA